MIQQSGFEKILRLFSVTSMNSSADFGPPLPSVGHLLEPSIRTVITNILEVYDPVDLQPSQQLMPCERLMVRLHTI